MKALAFVLLLIAMPAWAASTAPACGTFTAPYIDETTGLEVPGDAACPMVSAFSICPPMMGAEFTQALAWYKQNAYGTYDTRLMCRYHSWQPEMPFQGWIRSESLCWPWQRANIWGVRYLNGAFELRDGGDRGCAE